MLFRQPFKIEQTIGICLGLDIAFNNFKEDNKLFAIRQDRGEFLKKLA